MVNMGEVDDDAFTLFVGNLHERVTEEILYELFLQSGPLKRVSIPFDHKTGRKRCYGFVTFKHECSVPYSIKLMDGIKIFNNPLKVLRRKTNGSEPNGDHRQGHASPRSAPERPEMVNVPGPSIVLLPSPMNIHQSHQFAPRFPMQHPNFQHQARQSPDHRDFDRRDSFEMQRQFERGGWEQNDQYNDFSPRNPPQHRNEQRNHRRYPPHEQGDVRKVMMRSDHGQRRSEGYEGRRGPYKRRR